MHDKVALYSAVGDELTHYTVDVEEATLTPRSTLKLTANAQYAWPHPSRRFLYIATSNRDSAPKADYNHVAAYRVASDGALTLHGEPKVLPERAVHICLTPDGKWLLSGHNIPRPSITIHRIRDDGTIGDEVPQQAALEYGIYPHQVVVTPSGRAAVLVDRGNRATAEKPEDPGALRLFELHDGVLSPLQVIAPNGGYGFGIRHLDFHPTKPWVYVSLEIQNRLYMYRMAGDGFEAEAAYMRDTLADPANVKPRQLAGGIHVHPQGRAVYVANRADGLVEKNGQRVFNGGENNIAVFAIAPDTGEPTLIQNADTHSFHVRTFALDPAGKLMVAASIKPLQHLEDGVVRTVPAALSVFRVAADGKLDFVRKYDVPTEGRLQYWMGMVPLPQ